MLSHQGKLTIQYLLTAFLLVLLAGGFSWATEQQNNPPAEQPTWDKAGKEIKEAAHAVKEAGKKSYEEISESSAEVYQKTKKEAVEDWKKIKEKSSDVVEKTKAETKEGLEKTKEGSQNVWQKTKEETKEVYQKVRSKVHEATAPPVEEPAAAPSKE